MNKNRILILGASYGSLLGCKLALAGHDVHLICLPDEADVINRDGVLVRLPVRGRDAPVEIDSKQVDGKISAGDPASVDVDGFDLVALAMQEPQYRHDQIRGLLERVAAAGKPCMSIMNMPPLPYLRRIPGLDGDSLRQCYADASVWDPFDPALVTLCSPDPQAFRPPGEPLNVLQVTLPTNFKAARFEDDVHTEMLRGLQRDIEAATWRVGDEALALPVKLKVHESIFVPMAKWSMLLTGNYRCIQREQMIAIRDAVHHRRRGIAPYLRLDRRPVRRARRRARRPGAVREIRQGRRGPGQAVVGGARARGRRDPYRARRPVGQDDRAGKGLAGSGDRPDRRSRRAPFATKPRGVERRRLRGINGQN